MREVRVRSPQILLVIKYPTVRVVRAVLTPGHDDGFRGG